MAQMNNPHNNMNKDRTIFHVDVNSAFLSWSALKLLQEDPGSVDLRTIPSAVGGDVKTRHGIITAKSIPAKAYGVETGEPVVKALQKCPHLVTVPPDFETYRDYSHQLMEILARYTPIIQQTSIDEAYLDLTDVVDPADRTGAAALARQIRETVLSELGFTVNVGISTNKLLAKMASDFKKPNLTHTLYPDEVPARMWPLPIGSLYGCGKATAERLHLVGIGTIGDAARTDMQTLQSILGRNTGAYIWRSANGISNSPVKPEREQAKSISNERTLSEDINADNYEEKGIPVIRELAKKVTARMQKSQLTAQTITVQVKTAMFKRYTRQLVLSEGTDRPGEITDAALALAERLLRSPDGLFHEGASIRLIGVGVSKLAPKEFHQMDLFEWADRQKEEADHTAQKREEDKRAKVKREELTGPKEAEKERLMRRKKEKLGDMMSRINERFGDGAIKKGM